MTIEEFLGFLATIIKWVFILGVGWFVIVSLVSLMVWLAGRGERREFKRRFKQHRQEVDEALGRRRR